MTTDDLREQLATLQSRIDDTRRSLAEMYAERKILRKAAAGDRRTPRAAAKAARDSNLLRDYFQGVPHKALAEQYGLSRYYIKSLLAFYCANPHLEKRYWGLLAPDVIELVREENIRRMERLRERDIKWASRSSSFTPI